MLHEGIKQRRKWGGSQRSHGHTKKNKEKEAWILKGKKWSTYKKS